MPGRESLILASEGHCAGKSNFSGMSLSLTLASESEAALVFETLAREGKQ